MEKTFDSSIFLTCSASTLPEVFIFYPLNDPRAALDLTASYLRTTRMLQVAGCLSRPAGRLLEVACWKNIKINLPFSANSYLPLATCNLRPPTCNYPFPPTISFTLSRISVDDIGIPVVRLSLITSFPQRCPIRLAS